MFEQLKQEILSCRLCEARFGFEPHPVFTGNQNAKIMQISQAPSRTVHQTLKPFDDASGRKLRQEWYEITDETFYNPDNFYITAVAHCYPGKAVNGGDRPPPVSCARRWLMRELDLVQNDLYILIGAKAAGFFFPGEDFASLVFGDLTLNGKSLFVLPHPSPLNIKWFQDHPAFLKQKIVQIRKSVHIALNL